MTRLPPIPSLLPPLAVALSLIAGTIGVAAQEAPAAPTAEAVEGWPESVIPNFWDPRASREPIEIPPGRTIGFLTSGDFPPLHFLGADGAPTGFFVEVARAACDEAGLACTIQARPFDTLVPALDAGEGDAIAAALRTTGALRARHAVTAPFFRFPARLVARSDDVAGFSLDAMRDARVGLVAGTAHEAYVTAFWPSATRVPAPTLAEAQEALARGDTDVLFADGLALALWLGGRASRDCCGFVSGPFLDPAFFGEGVGFVFRSGDARLAQAFDTALARLWEKGTYAELWLRFFPVSPF